MKRICASVPAPSRLRVSSMMLSAFSCQELSCAGQVVNMTARSQITTCPAQDSSWQLKADSIMLDTRNRLGAGTDAQIRFMGVPLIYLPWVSFPLGNERKSGF